jgi:uncharacterized surface protein with fasciclin (FAS1) repeats
MKTLKLKVLALIAFLGIGLTSCNDDEPAPLGIPNPAASNLIAQMSVIPELTTMLAALDKTGLRQALSGSEQLTVYAPSNTAFAAFLTANSFLNLDAVPTADLKNLLLHHVLNGRIAIDGVDTNYYKTLGIDPVTTRSSWIISSGGSAKVNNDATVSAIRNVNASNGVLHVMNKVIKFATIADLVLGNENLSTLSGFVTNANNTDVAAALTASTDKTVFAPSNAAFATATNNGNNGAPIGFLFGNTSIPNVNALLKYHVTTGNRYAATLMNNDVINTFLTTPTQRTVQVSNSGTNISFIDSGATSNAKVTKADAEGRGGVVHVLSQVMNPFPL